MRTFLALTFFAAVLSAQPQTATSMAKTSLKKGKEPYVTKSPKKSAPPKKGVASTQSIAAKEGRKPVERGK